MTQTNSEHRFGVFHTYNLFQVFDGVLAMVGVTGAVTNEQAVKVWGGKHKDAAVR